MAIKGKLRSSSKIFELDDDETPRLNNKNSAAVIEYEPLSWNKIIKGWLRSIAIFIALALVLVLGVYSGLSATIIYGTSAKINGTNSVFMIARGTYTGGIVPAGAKIYVSTTRLLDNSFLTNLQQGFTGLPGGAQVQVLAGPVQKIQIDPANQQVQLLSTNGSPSSSVTGVVDNADSTKTFLQNEYLVRCLGGACKTGDLLIIKKEQISGEIISSRQGQAK